MIFRYLHLACEPPRFHDPALPLPATAHLLRPISFSKMGSEGLPTWLSPLAHRPAVYATLETVFNSRIPRAVPGDSGRPASRNRSKSSLPFGRDRYPC